jgi:hypothetical protein
MQSAEGMAERHLLARRLAVQVDEDRLHGAPQRVLRHQRIDHREGIVERVHEQPAHGVDHQHLPPARVAGDVAAGARRAGGEVEGTDQSRLAVDVAHDLALVPGMVARGDDIGAGGEDLLADLAGHAEAVGRVLAVDDREIRPQPLLQRRQVRVDGLTAGAADDVAAEQDAHGFRPRTVGGR